MTVLHGWVVVRTEEGQLRLRAIRQGSMGK